MCTELEDHLHFDYVRLAWDTGFCFDTSKSKPIFDFNALGLVDIDKVSLTRDIATVEKHIPTILQFQLDEELAKILEPTFVKVFRLCQFAVQYLRFCKKYLDNTVIILKKDLSLAYDENKVLKHQLEECKHDVENLKQKNIDLKDTFQCFNTTASYKCSECNKVFYSEEYLVAHQKRRHDSSEKSLIQTESDKLQLEIKELKQRLNNTEKYIQIEKQETIPVPNNDIVVVQDNNAELQNKFDKLKENIERELSSLKDESFFRNIYEKWFDDAFTKLQKESKKNMVEQASGDFVAFAESATQTSMIDSVGLQSTVDVEESGFVNQGTSTTTTPTIRQRCDVINDENKDKKLIMELEDKLKHNSEIYREKLENVMDQRITGSLERLETQMNSFWKKLSYLEQKKEDDEQRMIVQLHKQKTNEDFIQTSPPKITPRTIPQTKYISSKNIPRQQIIIQKQETSESESDSETISENSSIKNVKIKKTLPQPIPRTVPIMVTSKKINQSKENNPKHSLLNVKSMDFTKKVPIMEKNKKSDKELLPNSKESVSSIRVSQKSSVQKEFIPMTENKVIKDVQKIVVSSQSSLSSESDDESLTNKLEKKSSNISTLAQRSLTSLKNAVTDTDLTEGLKRELDEVVSLRLKEMGVAPQWKGLPNKSFQRALEIINHQASMIKKNVSNFDNIRGDIIKELESHISGGEKLDLSRNKGIRKIKKKVEHRHTHKREKASTRSTQVLKQDKYFEQTENQVTETRPIQTAPIVKPRQSVTVKDYDTEVTEIKPVQTAPLIKPRHSMAVRDYDTSDASTIDNKQLPTKAPQPVERKTEIALIETPSRSVLKSPSHIGQWTNKKKVIFNLDSDESSEINMKKQVKTQNFQNASAFMEGGSTTSIASSVLDESKVRSNTLGKENVDIQNNIKKDIKDDDISDWDISDILN